MTRRLLLPACLTVRRALQFVGKFFEGRVPAVHSSKGAEAVAELGAAVGPKV